MYTKKILRCFFPSSIPLYSYLFSLRRWQSSIVTLATEWQPPCSFSIALLMLYGEKLFPVGYLEQRAPVAMGKEGFSVYRHLAVHL